MIYLIQIVTNCPPPPSGHFQVGPATYTHPKIIKCSYDNYLNNYFNLLLSCTTCYMKRTNLLNRQIAMPGLHLRYLLFRLGPSFQHFSIGYYLQFTRYCHSTITKLHTVCPMVIPMRIPTLIPAPRGTFTNSKALRLA